MKEYLTIFWFRRDLRLDDNTALYYALQNQNVLPIFIFDTEILEDIHDKTDPRVSFIYDELMKLDTLLKKAASSLKIEYGKPLEVFKSLIENFSINKVYCNEDYEPYTIKRDVEIRNFLNQNNIEFNSYKDHIIFHPNEILKSDQKPYTIYTPYSKKWKEKFVQTEIKIYESENFLGNFYTTHFDFPTRTKIGFSESKIKVKPINYNTNILKNYHLYRDYPSQNFTTNASPHVRFGTVSIRKLIQYFSKINEILLNEFIWREFFIQILFHFPNVVQNSFKAKYDNIPWINNEDHLQKWKEGNTGYPIVDAGMRELNETGYMHNRVRMITASFLCKHLLCDWRIGEAYFAEKSLDFELASNNGNWQWSSGSGCDSAPYFRVFNPSIQTEKFDKELNYCNFWVKNLNEMDYPNPIVNHDFARKRAIEVYKKALQ